MPRPIGAEFFRARFSRAATNCFRRKEWGQCRRDSPHFSVSRIGPPLATTKNGDCPGFSVSRIGRRLATAKNGDCPLGLPPFSRRTNCGCTHSFTKFFSIQIPNQKVCCSFNRPQKILRSIKVRQSVFFTSVFDHFAIGNHIFDMVSDVFI